MLYCLKSLTIAVGLLALPLTVTAQTLGLDGSLYLYQTTGKAAPLSGYNVLLYDMNAKRWVGPSITDNRGRYAFYDLNTGPYLIHIYPPKIYSQNNIQSPGPQQLPVWQEVVQVKPPQQLQPIVLPLLRVYVQFRGNLQQPLVDGLRTKLRTNNYQVPEAEKMNIRFQSDVRYFNPEDRDLALKVLDLTAAHLASVRVSLDRPLVINDLSKSKFKAPKGQVEVWLNVR